MPLLFFIGGKFSGKRGYRVIGHFVCFLMPMKLVFIELHWHLFFFEMIFEGDKKCCKKSQNPCQYW